jgi:hypothetical protein
LEKFISGSESLDEKPPLVPAIDSLRRRVRAVGVGMMISRRVIVKRIALTKPARIRWVVMKGSKE